MNTLIFEAIYDGSRFNEIREYRYVIRLLKDRIYRGERIRSDWEAVPYLDNGNFPR